MITALPVKHTKPLDIGRILYTYIKQNYSEDVAKKFSSDVEAVNQDRYKMMSAIEHPSAGLEVFAHYLAVLRLVEVKFPGIALTVTWSDSLRTKNDFQSSDIQYEKICVMYNIAATLTHVAAEQKSDEAGMRKALSHLKTAAGWYQRVRIAMKSSLFNSNQLDLTDGVLLVLENFCIAQAQERFLRIAMAKNMKPESLSKISQLVSKQNSLCEEGLRQACARKPDKNLSCVFRANALLYSSLANESLSRLRASELKYGTEIGYLNLSTSLLQQALSLCDKCRSSSSSSSFFSSLFSSDDDLGKEFGPGVAHVNMAPLVAELNIQLQRMTKRLKQVTEENNSTYYQSITPIEVLEKPQQYDKPQQPVAQENLDEQTLIPLLPTVGAASGGAASSAAAPSSSSASGSTTPARPKLEKAFFAELIPMELVRFSQQFNEFSSNIVRQAFDEDEKVKKETRGKIEELEMLKTIEEVKAETGPLSSVLLQEARDAFKTGLAGGAAGAGALLGNLMTQCLTKRTQAATSLSSIQVSLSQLSSRMSYGSNSKEFSDLELESTRFDDSLTQAKQVDNQVQLKKSEHDPVLYAVDVCCKAEMDANPALYAEGGTATEDQNKKLSEALLGQLLSRGGNPAPGGSAPGTLSLSSDSLALRDAAVQLQNLLNTFQSAENAQSEDLEKLRDYASQAGTDVAQMIMQQGEGVTPQKALEDAKNNLTAKANEVREKLQRTKDLMPGLLEQHKKVQEMLCKAQHRPCPSGASASSSGSSSSSDPNAPMTRGEAIHRLESALSTFVLIKDHLRNGDTFYSTVLDRLKTLSQRIKQLESSSAPPPPARPAAPVQPPTQPSTQPGAYVAPPLQPYATPPPSQGYPRAPQAYPQQPYPPQGYPQQPYPPPGYPQQGYPPPAYPPNPAGSYPRSPYPPQGAPQQYGPQFGVPPKR